jgi:polyhydroxyalkanoate synthesis regulator phasin
MNADDVRKLLDSVFDKMSPAKAQEVAKGLVGEDRREQAQKLAGDLVETAQRNRDRVKELISREVSAQMRNMGGATQKDLDALKRRVRDLERATGVGAAGRSSAAKAAAKGGTSTSSTSTATAATPRKKPAAKRTPSSSPSAT